MKIRLLFILAFLPLVCLSQTDRKALFNEERTMDRRYTLYKGQFRVTGNYDFDVYKSFFDQNGNKSLLSDKGISQNRHSFLVNLRFGIIDYIDIQADFKYRTMNHRGEPIYIVAPPEPSIQVFNDVSTKGLEDMYLGLNTRLPIPSSKLDIGLSAGIYLPTANSQPDQPNHSYSTDELGQVINYHYLENWGYGKSSFYYKGFIKFRLTNLALSALFESRMPLGESEGLAWTSRLNDDKTFSYMSNVFQHQVPQAVHFNGMLEYQIYNWINIYLGFDSYKSMRGWSEDSGQKVSVPEEKQKWLSPGYEILITNKLWLRQGLLLPLGGESTYSQFSITTSFYYNLFMN